MKRLQQVGQGGLEVRAALRQFRADIDHRLGTAALQSLQHGGYFVASHGAEQFSHIPAVQLALPERDGLVGDGQGVPHAALRGLGDEVERFLLELDALRRHRLRQVGRNPLLGDVLKLKLQAAGQHRDRNLLGVRSGQQELNVVGRLLQSLQQGVEAGSGEHVDFVDEKYLEAPPGRRVLGLLQQFPGVVHSGAGGGVNLQQVDEAVLLHLPANGAFAAGVGADAGFAVQALGEYAGDGGLAHAPGAGEQIGVMQPPGIKAVPQRPHDVVLADEAVEVPRPQLPGQYLVAHRPILPLTPPKGATDAEAPAQ